MIVFYRGLHCPVCKKYLENLKSKLEDLSDRGVNVIAVSMDTEERAKRTGREWDITDLTIVMNYLKIQLGNEDFL